MELAFGRGEPFTLGIEEELFIVDRDRRLAPLAAAVLDGIDAPERNIGHEAYAAEIELRTDPHTGAGDAAAELRRLRESAAAAAAAEDGSLLAVGLHPGGRLGEAELVDAERYQRVLGEMRGLLQRTPECALHVHVGMPDEAAAVRAFNGLRGWMPLLAALAAASPYWFGVDSGLASARAAQVRAYPGRGIPPAFADLEDWQAACEAAASGGGPDDYTLLWWDVRLHPRLGTVEVRELDVQSRLEDTAAIAALVQGLARHEAQAGDSQPPLESIRWSAFRAQRDGTAAEILHDGRLAPVAEVARAAIAAATPAARELGSADALAGIERLLDEGGGAARQRRAVAGRGIDGLIDALAAETLG